jgi:hypothetical protein
MNVCNHHTCNFGCYKLDVDVSKKLCRFFQTLVNKTHFDNDTLLLHIKKLDKWLNNTNPWILLASKCNHGINFIFKKST